MNIVDNLQHITQTQIIQRIQYLIDANDGDVGRLCHILEFLKQNKPLYHSDQVYLENKLGTNNDTQKNNVPYFDVKTKDEINHGTEL